MLSQVLQGLYWWCDWLLGCSAFPERWACVACMLSFVSELESDSFSDCIHDSIVFNVPLVTDVLCPISTWDFVRLNAAVISMSQTRDFTLVDPSLASHVLYNDLILQLELILGCPPLFLRYSDLLFMKLLDQCIVVQLSDYAVGKLWFYSSSKEMLSSWTSLNLFMIVDWENHFSQICRGWFFLWLLDHILDLSDPAFGEPIALGVYADVVIWWIPRPSR